MSVDGDINTCFTTARETNPWWIVDLGAEYVVYGITIATSQDQTGSNQPRDVKVTHFNMGVYGAQRKKCTFCFIAKK